MRDSRDYIAQEAAEQEALKREYQRQLAVLPEGRLISSQIGKGIYYSEVENGEKRYLGSGSNAKVKALQQRRMIEQTIEHIDRNLDLMRAYTQEYKPINQEAVLQELPRAYRGEPESITGGGSWENEPYEKNERYSAEGLVHQTLKGEMVRSKSEVLLANLLYNKGIPYHYEENLNLPEGVLAPDFKIAVRSERRFKLLEHCGLIGNEKYARSFTWKMQTYIRNGYMPWRDVFFTFDDLNGSIDTRAISEMMDSYFL